MEKLKWWGYPRGKKTLRICVTVYTRYRRVTDGRTDRQTDRQTSCHGIVRAMHTRRAVQIKTRLSHCEKKLAGLLASSTQRTMSVNNWLRPLHFVYNSWQRRRSAWLTTAGVWRQSWTEDRIDIWIYSYVKPECLSSPSPGETSLNIFFLVRCVFSSVFFFMLQLLLYFVFLVRTFVTCSE